MAVTSDRKGNPLVSRLAGLTHTIRNPYHQKLSEVQYKAENEFLGYYKKKKIRTQE